MQALRKIRNIICFMGVLFCWGVAGSIELERISLTQGLEYIGTAAFCVAAAFVVEAAVKTARVLLIRYARAYNMKRKTLHRIRKAKAY